MYADTGLESEIKSAISADVWEQLKRVIGDAEVKVDIVKKINT